MKTTHQTGERDAEICRRYRAGDSAEEIGRSLIPRLSRQRIQQILRSRGVKQEDRLRGQTENDGFLGVLISESDKAALREIATKRGISMSALTNELIKEMLAEVRAQGAGE